MLMGLMITGLLILIICDWEQCSQPPKKKKPQRIRAMEKKVEINSEHFMDELKRVFKYKEEHPHFPDPEPSPDELLNQALAEKEALEEKIRKLEEETGKNTQRGLYR